MNPEDLLKVSKPARYVGGEINSAKKDPNRVRLKFALAFPDVYEVGMSHVGLQILYHILNQDPDILCERVFAPWPDMEKLLQDAGLPLTSLESSLPLQDFDVLGFSLQYELNYTGVLNILHLAGIPFRAEQRREKDPLIIGGGPCALNPEPLADFFDLFVLGDGEEAVREICQMITASREKGEGKKGLLARLSGLEGVYVPSFFQVEYEPDGPIRRILPLKEGYSTVRRRVLPDINRGDFPTHPVLPFMEIIHDRLNVEIARGCTRGCRFCQAGMIYRPLRERSPEGILQLIECGLKSTGYDEVSLLSLSTGDYSCIEPLLSMILEQTQSDRIAISLPSLRTETLTPALIEKIQAVRKTGFTLAPEAGTERLRRVINKGNTEEDLLLTIQRVFSANWRSVKLYFMIGLPTETEEDLRGIVSICHEALAVARRAKKSAQINISISTFIPKAHTPFQWEPMISRQEVERKHRFLRQHLDRKGLRFQGPDPRLSLLEGVFARGDRRLGRLLEIAHSLGCRLDGWGEHFRYDLWEKAFSQAGVKPDFYALRRRNSDEILPWDHIDSRVSKYFLEEERKRAYQGVPTPDCSHASCNGCGVCYGAPNLTRRVAIGTEILKGKASSPSRSKSLSDPTRRFRSRFAKFGPARFFGHLDLVQLMIRAFRRAGVPLLFSKGFHPLPRVSFGPPLPVGEESWAEYLDYHLQGKLLPEEATLRINAVLPYGVTLLETQEIPLKSPSIFDNIIKVLYLIRFSDSVDLPLEKGDSFLAASRFPVFWLRKKKTIDLKEKVHPFSWVKERTLKLGIHFASEGILRPEEVIDFIFGWDERVRPSVRIRKIKVQFKDSVPCPVKS